MAQELDPNCTGNFVIRAGNVYFQAGKHGLYRVPCDGSSDGVQLDVNKGPLAVPGDGFVYFQAGNRGLYRVASDASGPGTAVQLDDHCGNHIVVPGDDYVYFQAPGYGFYRVPSDASGPGTAVQLDEYCGDGIVIPGDGYAYFEGGPGKDSLYRLLIPNPFPPPPGYKIAVQDQYVVKTILPPDIDVKTDAIKALLNQAFTDSTETLFLNFTSGASTGAYPEAVADKIKGPIENYIKTLAVKPLDRLGTIIMDFPDSSLIDSIINYNLKSPRTISDWMFDIGDDNLLSKISIPGTHDSCTWGASAMSRCQSLMLDEQLAAGIRFIDIRCRQFNDKFELHHGREYLKLNFDYVLNICTAFLSANPTECIIMSVKEEHDPAGNRKTFQEVFNDYVPTNSTLWYRGNTIPKLGDVKGQIVLARRFYIEPNSKPEEWGLDMSVWSENATFSYP